jgi:protein TonB
MEPTPAYALPSHVAVLPATTDLSTPAEVFEAGAVDVKPEITRRVEPQYPDALRERGAGDVVIVRVLVSATGRPVETRLLRRSRVHGSLDDAAVAAVRQWTFSPARKRDRAVASWMNVGVAFRSPRELESR